MMNKPAARETDKRVPVAFGLMTFVLALLGSQQNPLANGGSTIAQPVATAFASASAAKG
jgi:hypothetical protein